MNPRVYKRKLKGEEEQKERKKPRLDEVEEILEKVRKECHFLKDPSLVRFAEQLERREQQKLTAQLEREELVRVQYIYRQFTCDWFVEELDFCTPNWRHLFKFPPTPPWRIT